MLKKLAGLPRTIVRAIKKTAQSIRWRRVLGPVLLLAVVLAAVVMVGNQPLPISDPTVIPEEVQVTITTPKPVDLQKTLLAKHLEQLLGEYQLLLERVEPQDVAVLGRAVRAAQGPENLLWPAEGEIVSAFSWYRHPLYQDWRYHPGMELALKEGEPIRAALNGQVQVVEETGPGLFRVVLEHGDGWLTTYDNLDRVNVNRGQTLSQGHSVGWAGAGHLLFTLRHQGKSVDPRQFVR